MCITAQEQSQSYARPERRAQQNVALATERAALRPEVCSRALRKVYYASVTAWNKRPFLSLRLKQLLVEHTNI